MITNTSALPRSDCGMTCSNDCAHRCLALGYHGGSFKTKLCYRTNIPHHPRPTVPIHQLVGLRCTMTCPTSNTNDTGTSSGRRTKGADMINLDKLYSCCTERLLGHMLMRTIYYACVYTLCIWHTTPAHIIPWYFLQSKTDIALF